MQKTVKVKDYGMLVKKELGHLSEIKMTSIAVVGKGGVGKTFVSANIARLFAREGYKVIAIDVDSNPTLGMSLGVSQDILDTITPIADQADLVHERTAIPGAPGTFRLNPQVSDLLDSFSVKAPDNVRLLVAGDIKTEQGCMCGAHALIKALFRHLVYSQSELVIFDMEAGLENFGRGTLKRVQHLIVVTEPSRQSKATLSRIADLAHEMGLPSERIWVIFNKWPDSNEKPLFDLVEKIGAKFLGVIPYSMEIAKADMEGTPLIDSNKDSPVLATISQLKTQLKEVLALDKPN